MGTEAAPSSFTFFRILLPGFTQELSNLQILPRKFSTSALMEENTKTASLVNPNGDAWRVSARRDARNMYIGGRGWLELVQAHDLRLGFFLIFQYEGNSDFHFRAFDLSTCEIAYPSTAKKANQTPTPAIIQVDDDDGKKEEHVNGEASSNARSKKGHAKNRANGCRFEVKLSACNITRGQVYIPVRFIQCVGLRPDQHEVTLKDPRGRLWTVGLWRRNEPRLRAGWQVELCRGWIRLARANKLKVGDRCAFELLRRQGEWHGMVWEVKILDDHA